MKKLAAVIVTYNNSEMLSHLMQDIAVQTRRPDEVIIVDNASSDGTDDMILQDFLDVTYLKLAENQGTAGGYLEGLKLAMKSNDLIWTLDDDVRLRNDSLEKLLKGLENLEYSGKVAAVRSVGHPNPEALPGEMELYTWRGTLMKADALRKVGLPHRKYFIYGEDLEHSLRLKKNGYTFFWIPSSGCFETREGKISDTLLGKPFRIYPDPFRFYYAFRNEFYIYLRYKQPMRCLRTVLYALKVTVYILISEHSNGLEKLKAIMAGFIYGFLGKLGKNAKYLPSNHVKK